MIQITLELTFVFLTGQQGNGYERGACDFSPNKSFVP